MDDKAALESVFCSTNIFSSITNVRLYAKLLGGGRGVRAHPSPPLRGSQSQTEV